MKKLVPILVLLLALVASTASAQLTPPTITATAKGPDQINLTWSAPTGCNSAAQSSIVCYGYIVSIQSAGDSRYSSYTPYVFTPQASGDANDQNTDPTCIYCFQPYMNGTTLPIWVTESQYVDPQDGTAAQAIIFGLKNNTTYNFKVRAFRYYTGTVYSAYSTAASATTANYTMRYVNVATGSDSNGGTDPITDAWLTIFHAGATVTAGTCVMIYPGNYNADYLHPVHSGTSAAAKIVFMSEPGAASPVFTGNSAGTPPIDNYANYIVVDGLSSVATPGAGAKEVNWIGAYGALLGGIGTP